MSRGANEYVSRIDKFQGWPAGGAFGCRHRFAQERFHFFLSARASMAKVLRTKTGVR